MVARTGPLCRLNRDRGRTRGVLPRRRPSAPDNALHTALPALADPAAGFRGEGNLGRGPNLGYPQKLKTSLILLTIFWMDSNSLSKKAF